MTKYRFKRQSDRITASLLLVIALAVVLAASKSYAESSLELVSQFDAMTGDYRLSRKKEDGIQLKYSTQSRFRGMFGWGWCSDLDAKLVKSASGSIVFRGCEVSTVNIVDPRVAAQELKLNRDGTYQRRRLDGDIQIFAQDGNLQGLIRSNGEVVRVRRSQSAVYMEGRQITKLVTDTESGAVIEIQEGDRGLWKLRFDGAMLVRFGEENYQYDVFRRMIRREYGALSVSGPVRELVGYRSDGIGIGRFERQAASPEERLLVMMRVNEESGKIEIEAERGAEMHPVRILYDLRLRTLELLGDRKTARSVLRYLMS